MHALSCSRRTPGCPDRVTGARREGLRSGLSDVPLQDRKYPGPVVATEGGLDMATEVRPASAAKCPGASRGWVTAVGVVVALRRYRINQSSSTHDLHRKAAPPQSIKSGECNGGHRVQYRRRTSR
jgi:hypothetical protein